LLGLLDLTAGRLDSAVEHFRQAIKLDDQLVDAYYYMAEAYFKNHQRAAAKEALAHCLDLDPTHQKAIALRAALEGADSQRRK
jgi:tetratricopeptide (TPR) repeat protein